MTPIIPTARLALLIVLAAPAVALSGSYPGLLEMALAWDLLVVAAAIFDWVQARRHARFSVERRLQGKFSLGAENPVRLAVHNESDAPLSLVIKDDPPAEFATPRRWVEVEAAPYSSAEGSYSTTPGSRGDYDFGDLHVRGRSPLGLSVWQRTFPARETVRVYPNMIAVRKYDLLARRARLEEAGFRQVRLRGAGTEFESLRDYVPDDEFRRIDWKATARRRKPITREYEVERSQTIVMMIDAGRMMSAELEGLSKLDHAINAALMLGYVAALRDDAVGLIAFADKMQAFVPARKGRAHLSLMAESLSQLAAVLREPDYQRGFAALHTVARKRALVVVFTDLIDPDASERLLAQVVGLYPHHLPLVVTITDSTLVRAARRAPDSPEQAYEKAMAEQVLLARQQALAALRFGGALVLDVEPGQLSVQVVNRYLELKARGKL